MVMNRLNTCSAEIHSAIEVEYSQGAPPKGLKVGMLSIQQKALEGQAFSC